VLEREFAVILLDVNMPDIDGLETARLIRQYKKSSLTPIIFITAYADEMQTALGYSLGAVDYILSPVRPDVLRSKVKVFVDLHNLQQRTRAMAEERIARELAEQASRRSAFLAHASRELGGSLDLEEAMRRLLELVTAHFGTHALLRIEDPPGHIISRGELAEAEGDPLVLPLRIGERILGSLSVAGVSAPDRKSLEELTDRAAVALENARLFGSLQREIVRARQAEGELQDANRRKDEFLAMLSHELRNPLAPIRNAVEVIRRLAPAEPRLTMARDVVDRQVTLLARLVDELLDVSRMTEGKISLKRTPQDLGRIVAQGAETVRPLAEARRQKITLDLPAGPVWVSGDAERLSQVVANLLNNACKYTQEGGRIEVSASAAEGEALITVRDNGQGIDAKLLPRVFDLFVQGERSLDRGQGGLGIGLTLVRRLVELHQGRVEAESAGPARGSAFRVYLPCISVVPAEEDEGASAVPTMSTQVYGRRVLVVDDNADAAESTAEFLRLEGHEVKTVYDGTQALAAVRVFAPHVIVLDIGLPGVDGYAVARRLREHGDTSHALLIALTGYGKKEDRERASAAGFDYHFTKPADPREIQRAIERGRAADATSDAARG
jgi:signal transduction histidine kinase